MGPPASHMPVPSVTHFHTTAQGPCLASAWPTGDSHLSRAGRRVHTPWSLGASQASELYQLTGSDPLLLTTPSM
jgi:hypothetical protein